MTKSKTVALPLACGVLAVLGVAATSAPSYAWPKSIRGVIYARAISPTGGSGFETPVSGTDFLANNFYRFDFGVTENNTATLNTPAISQWGPNSPTAGNLTGSLFSYLNISKCASVSTINDCSPGVVSTGVVGGTWNSNPANGSGTDLQTFGVGHGESPALNMVFGASSGTTGLTTKFGDTAAQAISNVTFGCDITNGCNGSGISSYSLEGESWGQIGGSISSLTASNIISNLGLTLNGQPVALMDADGTPRCTSTSYPSAACQLAIQVGQSGSILFNVNTVTFAYVPGPLPISATAIAFGYSRKLRRRMKTSVR